MTHTENYNICKPDKTEKYDINLYNINMDTIDSALSDVLSKVNTHEANGTNPHGTTKSDVGLGDVENKSSATIRDELTKENITNALGYVPYTPNDVAEMWNQYATKEELNALSDVVGQANALLESI